LQYIESSDKVSPTSLLRLNETLASPRSCNEVRIVCKIGQDESWGREESRKFWGADHKELKIESGKSMQSVIDDNNGTKLSNAQPTMNRLL
jgi:hypothetical protein